MSPVRYLVSPDVQILCESALLSFSEFSLAMNASLALWSACKFLVIILFVGVVVIAGAFAVWRDGSFGFVPMAN